LEKSLLSQKSGEEAKSTWLPARRNVQVRIQPVEEFQHKQSQSVALRIVKNGKTGMSKHQSGEQAAAC